MKGYTTTADLPADVQALYELTAPLEGGPTFDLPKVSQYRINFAKLTIAQAETLVRRKWKGIRRKEQPPAPPNTFVEGDDILEQSAPAPRTRSRKAADEQEGE